MKVLDDATFQPSTFSIKSCVGINDDTRGTYNANSKIKFKTTMLKSILCDYSDTYILIKEIIKDAKNTAVPPDRNNSQIKSKFRAPFTDWISKINIT